jgi:hypothetical protein
MSMKRMSDYCKAFPASRFRDFPNWSTARSVADDEVLFLHDNYLVTDGIFVDEQIVFDAVTPEWREFCRVTLGFEVPDYCRVESSVVASGVDDDGAPVRVGDAGAASEALNASEQASVVEQSA